MGSLFKDCKRVFVKPVTVWKQLKLGMKFVFYQSSKNMGLVRESKIKRIFLQEDPIKFFETYGDRIFPNKR